MYFAEFLFDKKRIISRFFNGKIDLNYFQVTVNEDVPGLVAVVHSNAVALAGVIEIDPVHLCH
jgi:hypothetical protein